MGVCRVIGIEAVLSHMKATEEKITGQWTDDAIRRFAFDLKKQIQDAAPSRVEPKFRKYGPIRKSVFVKKIEAGLAQAISGITYRVGITNRAFYAWFIEYGYSIGGKVKRKIQKGKSVTTHAGTGVTHIAARPFFRPAVDIAEHGTLLDQIIADFRKEFPELQ